jgi:hypothetical protein
VCHLRSICCSVSSRGDRARRSITRGRRDLFFGGRGCFNTGGCRRGSPCGRLGLLPLNRGPRRPPSRALLRWWEPSCLRRRQLRPQQRRRLRLPPGPQLRSPQR